jgi:L-ascorbate metabolism protein UlaG (beta-lactamase superfamily)
MEISYLGHSCFKLRGKHGTVICDPYQDSIGFSLPTTSGDIVTISHDHYDHNAADRVKGTARREKPFIITSPGEYEVGGISVFGIQTFHDAHEGIERGNNLVFTVFMDYITVCHLGDLGHELQEKHVQEIGTVDVLLIPVGGVYTINAETAVKVINELNPSYVIPMHYKSELHTSEQFAEVAPLKQFLDEYGVQKNPEKSLSVEAGSLPEETEIVLLQPQL